MKRFSTLMVLAVFAFAVTGCGGTNTLSGAAIAPQAAYENSSVGTLKPILLKQGLKSENPQANPKLVRVKKIAMEVIAETNKLTSEYNNSGDVQVLADLDHQLVRGWNRMMDVLDGDQDPMSLKVVAAMNEATDDYNKVLKEFEKTFFKTNAKKTQTVCRLLNIRRHAIERVYDLSCLATEQ